MTLRRLLPLLLVASPLWATTDTVLILHTNDLHDHIRPARDGIGGLPYVAGYIAQVKSERRDVLLLDGGDVMEKGDMLAFATKSLVMYKAMGRIGYDAVAVGNHDLAYGVDHLRLCEEKGQGLRVLCLNIRGEDGNPMLTPSAMFEVDGVDVGVIGLTVPKHDHTLSIEETGRVLEIEARGIDEEADLVVVVCHLPSGDCRKLSKAAPAVDVFVGGHSHEIIRDPVRVEETGALIVQAGQYARFVGQLEVTVDLETENVISVRGGLTEMEHSRVAPDTEMAAWIAAEEAKHCPEAARVVGHTDEPLNPAEMARLAAEALRHRAKADLGFCHTAKIMRSNLAAGSIDANALFLTGGQRGHDIVRATLSGRQVEAYLLDRAKPSASMSEWAGFRASITRGRRDSPASVRTDLNADARYSVVVCKREWDEKLGPSLRATEIGTGEKAPEALPCPFNFTSAMADYVAAMTSRNEPLPTVAERLAAAQKLE